MCLPNAMGARRPLHLSLIILLLTYIFPYCTMYIQSPSFIRHYILRIKRSMYGANLNYPMDAHHIVSFRHFFLPKKNLEFAVVMIKISIPHIQVMNEG